MPLSLSRRGQTEPFHAMDVLARANRLRAAGRDVVSLAVGQPGDPAPRAVREAAERAVSHGKLGYTNSLGRGELRRAISRHYRSHYGLDVGVERIVATTGSSAGFNLAFLALFDVGQRVAIAAPGYPAYRNIMGALGLEVVEIDQDERGYIGLDQLERAHSQKRLHGALIASPANPTGAEIPKDELEKIVAFCADAGIALISDEIYHGLSFVGPDVSALAYGEDVIVINSFSKYYCMTGWRIGWMVLPENAVRQVERIAQSLYISAPDISQIAACEAFAAGEELERVKARYRTNRALLAESLPQIGFDLVAPMDGAFYAYCDVSRHTDDSMAFSRRMLDEIGVAITPGRDFDIRHGAHTMRLSYAGTTQDIESALQRMKSWLA